MNSESSDAKGLSNCIMWLGVGLVLLKASGNTEWPWWAVTLPFWLPAAALAVVFFGGMAAVAMTAYYRDMKGKKRANNDLPK